MTINLLTEGQNGLNIMRIDDSTLVSQSRHTLRFQPIACRSIMRCPCVLTRPEMVWQAFVSDIASGQLAVFDMAEKKHPGKRNCCYGQCSSDERYTVKCVGVTFWPFPKPKTRMKDCKAWIRAVIDGQTCHFSSKKEKEKKKEKKNLVFSARNTSRKLCLGSLCTKRRHLDCFSITITQRKCVKQHFPFCRYFRFCLSSAYTVRAYIWRK